MAEQTLSKVTADPLQACFNVCCSLNLGFKMRSSRHELQAFAFETEMGYMAIVVQGGVLRQTNFDYPSAVAALHALEPEYRDHIVDEPPLPKLVARLTAYVAGERDDFRDVKLDLGHLTLFQRKVIERLRRVGYGKTVGYGELASLVGAPRAARAVGTTMACNHYPVIVPCHRVINSSGTLGNYGGPNGILTKYELLKLEGREIKPAAGKRLPSRLRATLAKR